jgi:hypothetical protein
MVVKNGWTEKIEELEKLNKGYETAYTITLLHREESKKLDRWFSNLCFREKLSLLDRHDIDDWFELNHTEKKAIYDTEVQNENCII